MNQLAVIETMSPIEIFGSGKLDDILSKIASDAKSVSLDISSEKGRKEVASLAYKIARSKTLLDDLGKKLGEDAQAKINAINADRKKTREFLDTLKDDIRKPLTDWENKEKDRILNHENMLSAIAEIGKHVSQNWQTLTFEHVQKKISEVGAISRDWEEFRARAESETFSTLAKLDTAAVNIKKRDEERAELERFRAAETVRIQKERDEKIAAEAAEKARIQAETKAKAEADRVAKEAEIERQRAAKEVEAERQRAAKEKAQAEEKANAAIREKELAEKRAKEAAAKAEQDKTRAIEAERQKIEMEKRAAEEAERKREANKRHAAKINNEVLAALMNIGSTVDESLAKLVITAIVSGKIPHTKISY